MKLKTKEPKDEGDAFVHSEESKKKKFDRELTKALLSLGSALIIAIVGVRCLLWAVELLLNRMG